MLNIEFFLNIRTGSLTHNYDMMLAFFGFDVVMKILCYLTRKVE
jgi:hypothetical protein